MKHFFRILGLLLFFPLIAFAEGVEDYYINATIEQDGSLLVEEYFTITGYYNGYERIIDYKNLSATPFNINASSYGGSTLHNGSGLEILKIGGADPYFNGNFSNLNVDAFNYDSGAEKGDYGVYDYDTTSTGKDIMIYNPSRKNKSFYLKYRLNNLAILFNDVGELGWNVIGNAFREDIENLVITLNIPGNNAEVKAWAHGPLNGLVNIDSKEKVTFTVKNLSAYTAIDIRSTFSPSIIINSSKKYDINALDKILAYEEKKAEEANELRRQNEANNEKKALNLLTTFKNDITRKNYENAYAAIDILMEGDTKSNYLEKLKIYKEQLDTIEEKTAVKYLDELENDLNMDNYDKTYAAILVLDNETKKEALILFKKNTYDLLLLDVTLPDGTGFDVCKEIRNSSTVPIIFLTASDQEISIVRGLDMGADDYITKPFKLNELLSRIKAILRRSLQFSKADTILEANGIRVDTSERLVWKNDEPLDLPLVEYKLLCLFMQNPNHLMPREMILDRMWDGNGNFVDDNTLSVYIRRLRNKIEDTPNQPKYLLTERGIGYKWVVE